MKLLDRVRDTMRLRHLSRKTEKAYTHWIVRFLRFFASRNADGTLASRHPDTMGDEEVRVFLTDLAVHGRVSASTQNQALAALLLLFQQVLEKPLGRIDALRASRPRRVPVVCRATKPSASSPRRPACTSSSPSGCTARGCA